MEQNIDERINTIVNNDNMDFTTKRKELMNIFMGLGKSYQAAYKRSRCLIDETYRKNIYLSTYKSIVNRRQVDQQFKLQLNSVSAAVQRNRYQNDEEYRKRKSEYARARRNLFKNVV